MKFLPLYKFLFLLLFVFTSSTSLSTKDSRIVSYMVDPVKSDLRMFWKDDHGVLFKNADSLKKFIESGDRKLVFAMNGGMYKTGNIPQGLYIEQGKVVSPLDTASGKGNFYMKPNGIFYLTKDKQAYISTTPKFSYSEQIQYATQSGPMLVVNGKIHPAFSERSSNLNIRNGVGILPGNKILFAISKEEVNFYDFALFFQQQGCKQALYLDGFVSKMYLPEKNILQTDGNLGVLIGVVK